jgi:type II secretory pathway pseudopilin PulG
LNNERIRGFTLVEVVAATLVLLVGIVAGLGALSSMSNTEVRMREAETMNRLAAQKLDEILAVGNVTTAATDGNFDDYGVSGYEWQLEVVPTGTENLDAVRVKVKPENNADRKPEAEISSLVFTSPNTVTGGTN